MSDSWITCCPGCATCFRVGEEQLAVARGLVRCGACLHVFVAMENLLQPDVPELEVEPVAEEPSPEGAEAKEEEPEPDEYEEPEEALPANVEEFDPRPEPADDPIVQEFDPHLGQPDDAIVQEFDSHLDEPSEAIVVEYETEPADREDPSAEETLYYDVPELTQSVDEGSLTDEERRRLHETLAFIPDEEIRRYPEPPAIARWLGWATLNLVMVAALLLQYGWFNRAELSQRESLRGIYVTLCRRVSCALPDFVDLEHLVARNLVVRTHPEVDDALVVDAILLNASDYPQPFPMLDLTFADIDNKRIAARRFKPDEYLRGEVASYRRIPARTEVRLSLEIVDPGEDAVSYRLAVVGINRANR